MGTMDALRAPVADARPASLSERWLAVGERLAQLDPAYFELALEDAESIAGLIARVKIERGEEIK